ncbi:protein-L-isoaspartate O-methyltransferase family protein, partial [Chamaesiphon polymorphus]
MNLAIKYQQQLLEKAQYLYRERPISEAVQQAYLATPRHLFLNRYRNWGVREWQEVDRENLAEHLATIYTDKPLILFGEDDDNIPSTISQPSFVMEMLDLLQIQPGQTIFELGAGSGWNAALMGNLVGLSGHVYSLKIIPEVARMAMETIKMLGIENVSIINADGGEGHGTDIQYDRAIFTAGAYDIPHYFYSQIKQDGLLLIVIKNQGGGDNLFLLKKTDNYFESLDSRACGFVQLKGRYQLDSLEPINIENLPEWVELQKQEVSRRAFWWGGNGKDAFQWYTMGIRNFLSISEPSFRAFKTEKKTPKSREYLYFGLWQQAQHSLVIAQNDLLIT